MKIDFLSPTYLWGLLGIGGPILIHLLTRRRQTRVKFSAISFLQEARKRSLKRSQPNRLLLLLVRCLALVFLSLALANPIFSLGANQELIFSSPSATVFILDNSYSMNSLTEQSTLYEEAVDQIAAITRKMPAHSEFSLITAASPTKILQEWTIDPDAIPNLLKNSQSSYATTDIGKSMGRAVQLLESTAQKIKNIYIVTDLSKNGWIKDSFPEDSENADTYAVKIVDLSKLQKGENRAAIRNVTVSREILANSRTIRVKASVVNLLASKRIDRLGISIWTNGKKQSEGTLEITPNGTSDKEFLIPYAGDEPLNGYVEIEEDSLATDNRRYFSYQRDQAINALVVDGDPKAVASQSESFYIERALNPFTSNIADINPTVSTLNELTQHKLNNYSTVIICNARNLPINYEIELEHYVMSGGSLFIAMGDQIDVKYYNEKLGNLLPVRIESMIDGIIDGKPTHIQTKKVDHPVFKIFSARNLLEMANIQFHTLYKVEPREDKAFSVPMSFENNLPAVIETSVGKGKVILYTSSIDRDWNEFPIQPTYLPWVQRWIKYISRGIDTSLDANLLVGETLTREDASEETFIQTPVGKIIAVDKKSNENIIRFDDTSRPGNYAIHRSREATQAKSSGAIVSLPPDAERIGGFTVNIDTSESAPDKISEKEIRDYLAGRQVEILDHKITGDIASTGNSLQLTAPLLLLMAFMFLCEGWMVRQD